MTNLIHLQNALNKVVEDVRVSTLEDFVKYVNEHDINLLEKDDDEVNEFIVEYNKKISSNTFLFGPKKKEKKSRPPNSYNMFIKDKMREIKEANPDFKGKELMRRATQAWNQQKLEKLQLANDNETEQNNHNQ
jgi:hypothetical protein